MLAPYIKQSFRQIMTQKLTSAIQIVGLGIGLGSAVLMLSFITHEYSFDTYHKNSKSIYRIRYDKDCSTPYIMGEALKSEIPEISNKFSIYGVWNVLLKKNDEFIKEENFILADSSIFSMLDIPVKAGNLRYLHQNSNDLVISDKAAYKYFGNKNPVGQPLEVIISGNKINCNISGIFKKFPSNSSIQAEFIGSIKMVDLALASQTLNFSTGKQENKPPDSWDKAGFQTFFLISNNKLISYIENKATLICQNANSKYDKKSKIYLQPFTSMYLHSGELSNINPLAESNLQSIRIFEWIGLLILIIAWFNYILLSTAETKSQLKEIAWRCKSLSATSSSYDCHNAALNPDGSGRSNSRCCPGIRMFRFSVPDFGRKNYLLLLPALKFVVPFLLLLPRDAKRNPRKLVPVAALLLFAQFLELFVMVGPAIGHGDQAAHAHLPIVEIAATLGFLGLFTLVFGWALARHDAVPLNDPALLECLEYHS